MFIGEQQHLQMKFGLSAVCVFVLAVRVTALRCGFGSYCNFDDHAIDNGISPNRNPIL
jgi:hypothetical protein